jgi:hypothetical protein
MYGRSGSDTASSRWRSTHRCSEETWRSTTSTAIAFCFGSLHEMQRWTPPVPLSPQEKIVTFLEVNGVVVVLEHDRWLAIFEGLAAGAVDRDALLAHVVEALGGDPWPLDLEPG